jgi:hypothetical protein
MMHFVQHSDICHAAPGRGKEYSLDQAGIELLPDTFCHIFKLRWVQFNRKSCTHLL